MPVTELGAAAMLAAGVAASPHCALMCGAVQDVQLRGVTGPRALFWVHAGRLLGYAGFGALAGAVGAQLLTVLPARTLAGPVELLAAALLAGLGLWYLRAPQSACAHAAGRAPNAPGLLRRGLAWSLVPCGVLYSMLFLAALSGSAVSGALLLGAFGLGTVPLLAGAGLGLRGARHRPRLRTTAAILLLGLGLASGWHAIAAPESGGIWCRSSTLLLPG